MGLAVSRATFMRKARSITSLLASFGLLVSLVSAIAVLSPLPIASATTVSQGAFDFNTGASNTVMKTADGTRVIPASTDFTVEAWVYVDTDTGGWQTILVQDQAAALMNAGRFYLGFYSGRNLHIGVGSQAVNTTVVMPLQTWTHVAVSVDRTGASTRTITYINGSPVYTWDYTSVDFTAAQGFAVGLATDGGYELDGKVDQVKIWNGALSAIDIATSQTAYAAGGISSGTLAAHYDFNEGTGSTINDRSGNGLNLSLTTGNSVFTSSSNPPSTTSAVPTTVAGTAGNAQVALTWAAPTFNGGASITGYTVTSSPSVTAPAGCTNTPNLLCTYSGLTNGIAYTFTVVAINSKGNSAPSTASSSVTPVTTPGAPTSLSATVGNTQVALSWVAPTSNGGSAITDYLVQYSTNGTDYTTFADGVSTTASATVTGLVNGTAYTFRVSTVNAVGTGSGATVSPTPFASCSPSSHTSGGYTYLAFKSTGSCLWSTPNGVTAIDYLMVAGGGGGGKIHAGGGGAGGLVKGTSVSLTSVSSLLLTVGDGGAGSSSASAPGTSGQNTVLAKASGSGSFTTQTANGGGGGGGSTSGGGGGGSSGGVYGTSSLGGATAGQGYSGAQGVPGTSSVWSAGGGGGAGAAGSAGSSSAGGAGGAGTTWISAFNSTIATGLSLTDTSGYFAGGGGGGITISSGSVSGGVGGTGGGGAGGGSGSYLSAGPTGAAGVSAIANTGGGGGGTGLEQGASHPTAGNGGSGVVLIRYINAPSITLSTSTISATVGSSVTSYTITNSNGPAASYAISPSLAVSGLSFSTSTGLISGTPTATASSANYTITATNTSGTSTATFSLSATYSTCSPSSSSSGGYTTLTFSSASTCEWSVPAGVSSADVLVVGGGGGGAANWSGSTGAGGSGGGGGVYTATAVPVSGTVVVTVGAGGAAGVSTTSQTGRSGSQGVTSAFGTLTAGGGGGGGCETGATNGQPCGSGTTIHGLPGTAGGNGGSPSNFWNAYNYGSPGAASNVTIGSKTFTAITGYQGGIYVLGSSVNNSAGSAGGAGGAGAYNTPGAGVTSTLTGSTVYGKGGSSWNATSWDLNSLSANTGYGGNGGYSSTGTATNGVSGSSGIVVVKYATVVSYTYDANNGTGTTPTGGSAQGGTSFTTAANPYSRSGYTFAGWNTAANGSGTSLTANASNSMPVSATSIVLYAQWTANSNAISYDNQGATTSQSGGSTTYTSGSAISTIPTTAPLRTYYTFVGWFTSASGGTQVTSGSYVPPSPYGGITLYAQWTLNGCPTPTTANGYSVVSITSVGLCSWSVPSGISKADILVVGGGGAGGTATNGSGGGGGGGQVNAQTAVTISGTYSVQVGAGGTAQSTASATPGGDGGTSSVTPSSGTAITALGGSGGASVTVGTGDVGRGSPGTAGFNGGGGSVWADRVSATNGSNGVGGSKGGAAIGSGSDANVQAAGGGGGSGVGAVGANATSGNGGSGGTGLSNSYIGTATIYGGGGGGGKRTNTGTAGSGGSGGGGAGGKAANGTDGSANTGGGGGGGGGETNAVGGAGGSGIVIIRYASIVNYTYDANGGTGTAPTAGSAQGGTAFTTAANTFSRTGYTFSGWYTTSTGTGGTSYTANASNTMQISATSIVLYAQWSADSNSISYDNQGATTSQSGGSTSYTSGSAILTIPTSAPAKTGYTFNGWFTASTGGTQVTDGSYTPSTPFGAITLYAQWSSTSRVITFNANDGSGTPATSTQTVVAGVSTALTQNTFTRTGYEFLGWSTAADGSGTTYLDQASITTSNAITLYAVWFQNTNLVLEYGSSTFTSSNPTWNPMVGSINANRTITGGSASSWTPASTTSPAFSNSSISGELFTTGNTKSLFTSNTVSIFAWVYPLGNNHSVVQERDNGVFTTAPTVHTTIIEMVSGVYNFMLPGCAPIAASSSTTTGFWHHVGLTYDGTTLRGYVDGAEVASGSCTRTVPAANLYYGVGGNDGNDMNPSAQAKGNIRLSSIQFFKTAIPLLKVSNLHLYSTITFKSNYTSGPSDTTLKVSNGTNVSLTANSFTRSTIPFLRWSNTASQNTAYLDGVQVNLRGNLNLYAQWGYLVTLSPGNFSSGSNQTYYKNYQTNLSLPNSSVASSWYTRTGYTIAGWSINADGSTQDYVLSGAYSTDAAITLYPYWQVNTVSVIFNNNGGSGSMTSQSIVPSTATTLTSNTFTRTGYTFNGWNTNADGTSGTNYTNGQSITITTGMTLYAKWLGDTLVVTYDSQGGTTVTSGSVATGANLTAPTAPTKSGYTFSGWSTTSSGSVVSFSGGYAHGQTTNFTLYAIWAANTQTITYAAGSGGTGTAPSSPTSVSYGSTFTTPANTYSRSGYTFAGWSDGTSTYAAAATYPATGTVSGNVTLTATWTANSVTVAFDTQGGSAISSQSWTVGTALTYPTQPTRAGYSFNAWYDAASGGNQVGRSSLSFDGVNDRVTVPHSTAFNFTSALTIEAWINTRATRTQYITTKGDDSFFIALDPTGKLSIFLNGVATTWFYSSISVNDGNWHHIAATYDGTVVKGYIDGVERISSTKSGTIPTGTALVEIGSRTNPSNVAYSYHFTGKIYDVRYWNVARTASQISSSMNSQLTGSESGLVAAFSLNHGVPGGTNTGVTTATNTVSAGDNGTLSGFGLTGTTSNWVQSGSSYLPANTAGFTLYADWAPLALTITYNSQSGSAVTAGSVNTGASISSAPTAPTRTGYTFSGWSTTTTGSVISFPYAHGQTANFTLYAIWSANTLTVTYDSQGGSSVTSGSIATGANLTAPTSPTKSGYTFSGWSTTSSGSVVTFPYAHGQTANFTLFAIWSANTLTVTYDSQGGTSVTSGTVNTGANLTAPTAPTKAGYSFSGWSTTSSGSVVSFTGGYAHGQTANFTLYAIWSADSLAVTYDSQGGTSVTSGSVATGASISAAPTPPTRTGYTFSGWSATSTGSVVSFPYAHGQTANFTLYAIWAANALTITYDEQGGSSISDGTVSVGASISAAPTAPIRAGYSLTGWSTTSTGSVVSFPYSHGQTSNFTLYAIWSAVSCSPTSTTAGGYTIYTFTTAGTCFWTVPNGVTDVEVLAVAGGGGGGYAWDNAGAGGGAGGQVKTGTATLSTTLEVTVGAGGSAGIVSSTRGGTGGNSVVSTITALGGTGGCSARATTCSDSAQATSLAAAKGGAGGAGGASGKGGGGSNTTGSLTSTTSGGTGTASTYSGSSVTYGVGGTGGTARAATTNIAGTAGSANTGNGGGGASAKSSSGEVNGGAGGTGLVVVRVASALTVTYDSQSGSAVSDGSTLTGGTIATTPTDPTRTNYTFLGWFTATSGGTAISFPYTHGQTANFTLYARWTLNSYAITFNANNGTGSMGNQSFTHGVAVNLNANLYTRANYVFYRWATNADGTGTTYSNLAQVTLTAATTLYAQWTANTYVVTYNYNDATGGNSSATDSFTTGGTAIVLPTPTKTGYTFAGWYSDAGLSSSIGSAGANYSPTGATLTLNAYAKWTAVNYTFTYNGNNADNATDVPTETTKQIGQTATIKANTGGLTRSGYTFGGWNTQSNGSGTNYLSGSLFTVGSSNVTLYAKWTANTYTVTYNSNGGSGNAQRSSNNVSSDSYTTGGSAIVLPGAGTLSRSGYTFDGWNTSAAGTGTSYAATDNYTTVSNVIFYAKWNPVTYSITYDGNTSDGGSTPTTGGYTTGQASPYSVLTNTFTKTSNVFGGWNTAANGTGTSYSPGASITTLSNIVLYATWIPQYTLHYAINGGSVSSGSLPADQLYNTGTSVGPLFSSVSRTGYTFGGWLNGATTIAANGNFTILADSVLTAKWTPINYTISYNSDGGTEAPSSITKQIGQSYTVGAAVSKPGYNFTGWSNGSSVVGAGATIVTGSSDVTYTAQWTAKIYTISYDWNGGRGTAVSDVNYTFGTTAITLPLVGDRVKDGYTFAGWSESSNGSALASTYIPSQSRTLYALWNIGNFTVTYDAGRGTVANSSVPVTNGGSTVLPLPTRANFTFNGWHTAVNGGTRIGGNGDSFTPSASQTVYARWIQNSLYGITDSLNRIGSVVTVSNVANTFSGANSNSSVAVSIPANALPAGTTINFDLVSNSSRATGVLSGVNYLVSIALSWLTGDETVPDTASGKPISVTISNATIKAGAAAYAIVNNVSTLLGTATQDGVITVSITSDPEIVVAAVKPGAPTSVAATSNGNQQSVISWSAPSSDGGSAITGYTVTSNTGATCTTSTTSCTISSLANGTAYTFTVTATNTVGTSVASSSASATTAALYAVTFDSKGGSSVTSGSFLTASTVSEPTAPTRTGYSFAGWSATDGGSAVTFPYAPGVTTAITMYARWDALDNAVTFDSKGGSSVNSSIFSSGGTVAEPTAPTKSGYTFAGWSATDGGSAVTFPYAPGVVTDITLYARWTVVSQNSSGGGGGGSTTPAPSTPAEPSVPSMPVKSNVTVVAPVTVVGDTQTKVPTVEVSTNSTTPGSKPPAVKVDAVSEKFIADVKIVDGKLLLTPETGFSGKKTVTVTITENGTDRIVQIPLTVLPEAVTKPVLTPTALNKSIIRWTESPNADAYTVYLNGKKVCSTTALSCSVKTILGPDANIEIVSNGGDRTISERVDAEFRQNIPVAITRLVSATITKATLTKVDTKALDQVVALIKNQGFGTVVISEITTTSKTKALAAARIESIKKYISSKIGSEQVEFEITPVKSRTYFNNISVKG